MKGSPFHSTRVIAGALLLCSGASLGLAQGPLDAPGSPTAPARLATAPAVILDPNLAQCIAAQGVTTSSTELSCYGYGIKSLVGLGAFTALQTLLLGSNQISSLAPLAGLTALHWLDLGSNQITDLAPLAGLSGLQELYLWDNQITDLAPLAGLSGLQELDLWFNQITNLAPLAGLTALHRLDLGSNQISNLAPLAGLTGLQDLYLDSNQISDLTPLPLLLPDGSLELSDNTDITDVRPLLSQSGIDIGLYGNDQIPCSQLAVLLAREDLRIVPPDQCASSPTEACTSYSLLLKPITFGSGPHRLASEVGIVTQGPVQLLAGADLSLRAPRHQFGPGFRVAAGAQLHARVEAVTCPAGSVPGADGVVLQPSRMSADTLDAPMPMRPDALPEAARERLAAHGVDLASIAQALLDTQGRWLLIETAQDILAVDANGVADLYRLDLIEDRLNLISGTPGGVAGNGSSRYPAADASGEWIIFQSDATDLVADDTNAVTDIFLHEWTAGLTRRITETAEQASARPAIDAAGLDLVFDQVGTDGARRILLERSWGGQAQPFEAGAGAAEASDQHHPAISADGRFVAFIAERPVADGTRCEVQFVDRARGVSQGVACPDALARATESVRPHFSPDGARLEWMFSEIDLGLMMMNPLRDAALD